MLSDDAQSLFVRYLIRIRDRIANVERNANDEPNAISLRLEKKTKIAFDDVEKRKKIVFDDVEKRKKEIAFDDVVVVRSKTSRMTRNLSRYYVCERSRLN
jgi:hypothetical protein